MTITNHELNPQLITNLQTFQRLDHDYELRLRARNPMSDVRRLGTSLEHRLLSYSRFFANF